MKKRLFKPTKIGFATALISLTSLISYGIALIRDRIISTNFGTTGATDAYNAAFLIPDFLFNLFIAGALSAAFLPIFSDYLEKDQEEARTLANTMLTAATVVITILALIAYFSAGSIIPHIITDNPELHGDIINMTRIMLLSAILFAISNTLGNILMSYKHFFAYSISPVLYNLGIILGVIFFSDSMGIYSASIGVVLGATLHCAIRIIDTINTPYKFKPQLQITHPGFKKIIKLMIPRSISLISWQLNLTIFGIVGIKMIEGGFSAFNYARNIQSFAVSLFGIAFATAAFPYITNSANRNDKEAYTQSIQKTIQRILFFTIPAAVGLTMLAQPTVELILQGGVFQEQSTKLTALILTFFAISIPFESLSHILARAFYALKNTTTPMIINITTMTIIGCITYFVAPRYGIQWFSIGFSIGFAFYVLAASILISKHFQNFQTTQFLKSFSKIILSSTLMALVLYVLSGQNVIIQIPIGATVFLLSSFFLKSPELESTTYLLNKLIKKS